MVVKKPTKHRELSLQSLSKLAKLQSPQENSSTIKIRQPNQSEIEVQLQINKRKMNYIKNSSSGGNEPAQQVIKATHKKAI